MMGSNHLKIAIAYNDPDHDERCAKLQLHEETTVLDEVISVENALTGYRYSSYRIPMNGKLDKFIQKLHEPKPDVVFNLCESVNGDSLQEMNVPAIYELLNLAYTGSSPLALGLAVNKARVKTLLQAHGIPTAPYKIFQSVREKWYYDFPAIVKPLHEDGSFGISKNSVVKNEEELREQVYTILQKFQEPALVEKFITGRELHVTLIGENHDPRPMPVSEIDLSGLPRSHPRIVTYDVKWSEHTREYQQTQILCPAVLKPKELQPLIEVAKAAYQVVGCRDYARIDMRLETKTGIPYVLEVNPNPDITNEPGIGIVQAITAGGISYEEFIQFVIQSAWRRGQSRWESSTP